MRLRCELLNHLTGSLSVLVWTETGAVRKLVVRNSTPARCPLPCLTIKQKAFSIWISTDCSEEPFTAQMQGKRDYSRPLPVVVQSRHTLAQLLFCSELRKDAFDGGEKWTGSHTFLKVFMCYTTTSGLTRPKFLELTLPRTPMEWKHPIWPDNVVLTVLLSCSVLSALDVLTYLTFKTILELMRKILSLRSFSPL